MRNRTAFTLIETLVALVLFQFAMLALTAVAAVAARDLATARRIDRAYDAARNRVERLASQCPDPAAGTVGTSAFVEHWRVEIMDRRRFVTDSVVYVKNDGRAAFVVARGTVLCAT